MTSRTVSHAYTPDHASPPGDLVQEYLEQLGISARELARRCGRSGKLMAEIVSGKAPLEPATALQLERVLDVPAAVWSNMEAAYQLHQARDAESEDLAARHDWAEAFPIKELAARGYLKRLQGKVDQVLEVLRFFGVGGILACEDKIDELLQVDYRTSPTFDNDQWALAAWLRIGERRAAGIDCQNYDRDAFLAALKDIRALTLVPINEALPKIEARCAAAGVAFVLELALPKTRASGVSRWLTPRKGLIQQSFRYKSDDHFWFTFFHECAHLLLHSRKTIFIDMMKGSGSAGPKEEAEANTWAADFLVPSAAMRAFRLNFTQTEAEVRTFARSLGIAPGIVVGQLQHNGVIPFGAMNQLKTYYTT
ncbi:MAG: HigA family addiction module antitoxin [Paracoccaceae bacterium]